MGELIVTIIIVVARLSAILLITGSLTYFIRRHACGKPVNWPVTVATISLLFSAALILMSAQETKTSPEWAVSSNFLALESGCFALDASFVLVWSIAWLVAPPDKPELSDWRVIVAMIAIVLSAGAMFFLLPLPGKPDWRLRIF